MAHIYLAQTSHFATLSNFFYFLHSAKNMAFLQRWIQSLLTIRAVRLNLRWSHRGVWLSWHVLSSWGRNKQNYIYDDPKKIPHHVSKLQTELNPHIKDLISIHTPMSTVLEKHRTFFMSCEVCSWRYFWHHDSKPLRCEPKQHLLVAQLFHMYTSCQRFADCLVGWKHDKESQAPISKQKRAPYHIEGPQVSAR